MPSCRIVGSQENLRTLVMQMNKHGYFLWLYGCNLVEKDGLQTSVNIREMSSQENGALIIHITLSQSGSGYSCVTYISIKSVIMGSFLVWLSMFIAIWSLNLAFYSAILSQVRKDNMYCTPLDGIKNIFLV
eukprot:TRINITY_DN20218_c0_g1_i3.p1 TRINITY_DN20218_c0_g1~~TRINITY_DN20218_c0_g1_i3.p1  ORF type:complete len:131 (-),score=5.34 TRINITY_DN20218_c0_g1_i3:28-420(-)